MWREDYRAQLAADGRAWYHDVVREESPVRPGRTWLRHVPTGVLIHHDGRPDAETFAHLADLLGQHRVIGEEERLAVHAGTVSLPSG